MGINNELVSRDFEASRIPATIRVGVTGHRVLENESGVRESVRRELARLEALAGKKLRKSPHVFVAVSPLAEGADRLVAQEVLNLAANEKNLPPMLDVVLPMPEEVYTKDFSAEGSMEEYLNLKKKAHFVKSLDYHGSRTEAFENVGRYVVQNCDVLFVVWNGENPKKKGGTYDIFQYAKEYRCIYILINSITGEVTESTLDEKEFFNPLKPLDKFNGEWFLKRSEISSFADMRFQKFLGKVPDDTLSPEARQSFRNSLMPKYARASLLSKRYKKWYSYANLSIYGLAILTVATVALQSNFFPGQTGIAWLEAGYMGLIFIIVIFLNKIALHRCWIDYRFIAERIRTTIFFTLAGIDYEPLRYLPHVNKGKQEDYWIVNAFSWIWRSRPVNAIVCPSDISTVNRLKEYLKNAWVKDQWKFYDENGHSLKKKHEFYDRVGIGLFIVTFFVALSQALGLHLYTSESMATAVLSSLSSILPAMAAALAGILSNREYNRIATRYEQMVSPLENIMQELDATTSIEKLIKLLEQANEFMLRENQDWRVSFLMQSLKPP